MFANQMGWNYSVCPQKMPRQNKLDPRTWTEKNIEVMNAIKETWLIYYRQGEISTCSSIIININKIFLEMYDKG